MRLYINSFKTTIKRTHYRTNQFRKKIFGKSKICAFQESEFQIKNKQSNSYLFKMTIRDLQFGSLVAAFFLLLRIHYVSTLFLLFQILSCSLEWWYCFRTNRLISLHEHGALQIVLTYFNLTINGTWHVFLAGSMVFLCFIFSFSFSLAYTRYDFDPRHFYCK